LLGDVCRYHVPRLGTLPVGGEISAVAAVYNPHQYLDEMREAVEKWEQYLAHLLKQAINLAG
jgi:hypothetical protein